MNIHISHNMLMVKFFSLLFPSQLVIPLVSFYFNAMSEFT